MERIDDFEVRFQKKYKEEMEFLKPNMELESRLENAIKKPNSRYMWKIRPATVLCSIVLLMIVCAGLLYNNDLFKTDHAFIIYTYANDERVDLKENIEVTLPSGKYTEDSIKREFRGNNHFYIEGDGIKLVRLQCESGTIVYFDEKKKEEMDRNGDLYIVKILLDPKEYNLTAPFHYQDFENLWNNGMLDEYKEKYFQGMSTDLSDYEVGIQTSENNGKLDHAEFLIQTKEQVSKESKLYIKGKDVTLEYPEGYILDPVWFMTDPKEIETNSTITESSQPKGDKIAMTIEFLDGKMKNYQIEISFNASGNMNVELEPNT